MGVGVLPSTHNQDTKCTTQQRWSRLQSLRFVLTPIVVRGNKCTHELMGRDEARLTGGGRANTEASRPLQQAVPFLAPCRLTNGYGI